MTTSAKIIADSVSEHDIRITTMELEYPIIIHAEFMTHRMFSRNAASNRAIPTKKILEQVENDPFIPAYWGKNQPGMQANEELDAQAIHNSMMDWTDARDDAVFWARNLVEEGVHKQLANRLLMPFQYIKVIVTATEWDNFFKLRLHKDAQPEIRELAECMKEALDNSNPKLLKYGEWHLPYITKEELVKYNNDGFGTPMLASSARCARISGMNHDNSNPIVENDLDLAASLFERPYTNKKGKIFIESDPRHMSPFEHQATPMKSPVCLVVRDMEEGATHVDRDDSQWSGNFRGWIQYRQII